MTAYQISFWTLIAIGITAVAYIGQLVVLVLIYFRVIREADRNAEIRKQEIAKAGDQMTAIQADTGRRINAMAKRNMVGMGLMGALVASLIFVNRVYIHKIEKWEKRSKHD